MSDKPAKHLMKTACALALALAAATAFAQADDPLKSSACAEALAGLQAARAANAGSATVETARGAAAAACLGIATLPQRPSRVLRSPESVPPPQVDLPLRVTPHPGPALPPPPVAIDRPGTAGFCDGNGCWIDGGTHLRQLGPNLMGPNGLCTQQGLLISCP
jgi:hypothetical protein